MSWGRNGLREQVREAKEGHWAPERGRQRDHPAEGQRGGGLHGSTYNPETKSDHTGWSEMNTF